MLPNEDIQKIYDKLLMEFYKVGNTEQCEELTYLLDNLITELLKYIK